jgi:TonB family protein
MTIRSCLIVAVAVALQVRPNAAPATERVVGRVVSVQCGSDLGHPLMLLDVSPHKDLVRLQFTSELSDADRAAALALLDQKVAAVGSRGRQDGRPVLTVSSFGDVSLDGARAAVPALPAGVVRNCEADVVLPRLLGSGPVHIPPEAFSGRHGTVVVEVVVDVLGNVSGARVTRSVDASSGLDAAFVDAFKRHRFAPGTRRGVPVAVAFFLLGEFKDER